MLFYVDISSVCHLRKLDSSTSILWTSPFLTEGLSTKFLFLKSFLDIRVSNTNSAYPDQTPRTAASDLGLHCLPICLLWDARHRIISE